MKKLVTMLAVVMGVCFMHVSAYATPVPAPVPEPTTVLLVGLGLLALLGLRKAKRN
jgi:hypothetical protein